PYFFVDFGEYSLPEQFLTKEFDDKREDFRHEQIYEQKRYVGTIMSDHITDDYIQYQSTVGGTYYYGLYSKANGINQVYSGVRNDIYGLPIPGITLMPGNRAYGIVSPGLLYQYRDFI